MNSASNSCQWKLFLRSARLRFANGFRLCSKVVLLVVYFSATDEQCLNCLSQPR